MKKTVTALTLSAIAFGNVWADDEPKFSATPIGRILLDGALYAPRNGVFTDGVAIPDLRIGVNATAGKWFAKVDGCFAYGKVSMKDVYLEYTHDDHHRFTAGYFTPEFALNTPVSSAMKATMEEVTSDVFTNATARNIALMYTYSSKYFWTAISGFTDAESLLTPANEQGKTSIGATNRSFLRLVSADDAVVQGGFSTSYQTALHQIVTNPDGTTSVSPGYFDFAADFPTRVCSVPMIDAHIDYARGALLLSPELLIIRGRLAIESQYYYMNVNRTNTLPSYRAKGAYGMLRFLAKGAPYSYDYTEGCVNTPGPHALEFTAAFDITDANCPKAEVWGGISRDFSLTMSYYLTSSMIARLRYSWTDVRKGSTRPDAHVNILQARFQVCF